MEDAIEAVIKTRVDPWWKSRHVNYLRWSLTEPGPDLVIPTSSTEIIVELIP